MAIKKLLLLLPTYPDAPSEHALESAVLLAQLLGAEITASILQVDRDKATWPPSLGAWPVDVPAMMEEAVQRSEHNAKLVADVLKTLSAEFRVTVEILPRKTTLYSSPRSMLELARVYDLTVMPVPEIDSFGRADVETVIFGSGRPTLLLPSGIGHKRLQSLDTIVVAWDSSREAASALADALPILALAKRVFILSVLGEKKTDAACSIEELKRYLGSHQVNCIVEQRPLQGQRISDVMATFAMETKADMWVMGAYGHSRIREFVLGGATSGMLSDPPLPLFLSH